MSANTQTLSGLPPATAEIAAVLSLVAFAVTTAHIGGTSVPPGTYTAAQMQALGFDEVIDTADGAGGSLIVKGRPFLIMVR